jgi:hypothetical protein
MYELSLKAAEQFSHFLAESPMRQREHSHPVPSAVHFGIFWLFKHKGTPTQQICFGRFDCRLTGISILVVDISFAQ